MATLIPTSTSLVDFVYVDLDGVVADFDTAKINQGHLDGDIFKRLPGAYTYLPFMSGAEEAVRLLRLTFGMERVWFLTKPPKNAPYVWAEKALWVQHYLGDIALHNLIITMDKSHVGTEKSILIDDRPHKGGVDRFRGTFIHFDRDWKKALQDLQVVLSNLHTPPPVAS